MISKIVSTTFIAFAVLQTAGARLYCDLEVEYSGQDPEFALTEVRRSVYREYETVRIELEETDCGGGGGGGDDAGSSRCAQKRSLLDALCRARFRLDEFLCELNTSVVARMRDAYTAHGCSSEYSRLLDQLWLDTETQLRPYLVAFREHVARPRSFLDGVLGGVKSAVRGIVGGC